MFKIIRFILFIFFLVFVVAFFLGFSPAQIKLNLIDLFSSGLNTFDQNFIPIEDNDIIDNHFPTPIIQKESLSQLSYIEEEKVFEITNNYRNLEKVPIFFWNDVLAKAAETKAKDMFLKQYFAHNSPEGKTPADLVSEAGYDYIKTGENLALGVFKDEDDLVKAWMDSPGHRENILNPKFRELGLAVVSGYYKGDKVIIAVQEFGTGSYVCDKPSESNKNLLSTDYNILNELGKQIAESEKAISKLDKNDPNYRSSVDSYNQIVTIYNSKIADLKSKTEIYNQKVNSYNKCIDNL